MYVPLPLGLPSYAPLFLFGFWLISIAIPLMKVSLLQLKLVNPSISRIEHLVTQMNWRLKEGGGEAIYEIGVEDNGKLTGLTKEDLESSLKTIDALAGR